MEDLGGLLGAAIAVAVVGVFLWLGRELVNWYFKINMRVEQNEQIIKLLTKIANRLPEQDEFMK